MAPPPTLGLILAGGLARRMGGGDKPLLGLGGRTLLDRVIERLGPQCEAGLALSANGDPTRFAGFVGPVLADPATESLGPLAGILAGLDFAALHHPSVRYVASVAGDTPFVPRDFVARLHAALDDVGQPIAVAASGGREHYVAALWRVSLRAELRTALLARGERRLGAVIARQGRVIATWPNTPFDPFLNINEPTDLVAAEAILTDPGRFSGL